MSPFVYIFFAMGATVVFLSGLFAAGKMRAHADVRRNPVLIPGERPTALAAGADALVARAPQSPELLSTFLDTYLGSAVAAKRDAWERAQSDATYLRQLASDHLGRLSDAEVCRQWLAWSDSVEKFPPGLNPAERLAPHEAARRLLDKRQAIVAAVGCGLMFVLLLFPPWLRRQDDITKFLLTTTAYRVLDERFLGYRFVGAPGWPPNTSRSVPTGDLGKFRWTRDRSVIHGPLAALQTVVLLAGCVTGVVLVREPIRDEGK